MIISKVCSFELLEEIIDDIEGFFNYDYLVILNGKVFHVGYYHYVAFIDPIQTLRVLSAFEMQPEALYLFFTNENGEQENILFIKDENDKTTIQKCKELIEDYQKTSKSH